MFAWLQQFFTSMMPQLKTLVTLMVYAVVVVFAAKPFFNGCRELGDKQWGKALSSFVSCALVVSVATMLTKFFYNAGLHIGNDMNTQANLISLLPSLIPMFYATVTNAINATNKPVIGKIE